MKISVVIPTFNEEVYIKRCLDSVFDQTIKADEVIVVNNNSTDRTVEIAQSFPVKIINEKIQGMTPARNKGFDEAKYDILARIDADCIVPKDWIKEIKRFFETTNYDAFGGPIRYYGIFQKPTPAILSRIQLELSKVSNHGNMTFQGSNMILKRKIWEKVKNNICLDDKEVQEDLDLALNIIKIGGKIGLDPNLVIETSGRRIKHNPKEFFIGFTIKAYKTYQINK